ncbi:MAG: hypothetical protein C0506_09500 [Anaerolinea sp.]|nr:hypothetical protein [Anaerolinea sp.]
MPPPPPAVHAPNALFQRLRRPQYLIPIAVVGGMVGIAFGVQPRSTPTEARGANVSLTARAGADPTATAAVPSPTAKPSTQPASPTPASGTAAANAASQNQASIAPAATDQVAGARGTPPATASAAAQVDLSRQTTQCGAIQEVTVALSVEQVISGVSVKATRAAAYPIEYFRCILMATGGVEAINLAQSVQKAANNGMTGAVLIDLWLTNASREFGQVNLKTAQLSLAGQTFSPLATLGGRSEVVVSSGQGRAVTLVVTFKNTVGTTPGPMTLIVEAPLAGGKQTLGKYQLFLPTP